jgi:hypothetical protein
MHVEVPQVDVPTLASIPLCPAAGCAGAAFELQSAARESETTAFDGWEAEVVEGHRVVVARGGSERSYDHALRSGLLHAQKGLDLMSLNGTNNLVIKGFADDHVVWWPELVGLTIRVVSFAPMRIDTPPVTVTVTDASGNIVPEPVSPPIVWHESFRYFRLSQTTDDLFDAYRNAYLALESVLSSIAPQVTKAGKVVEREGVWFKRALREAGKVVPLASVVPPATADPLQYLFDDLYVDMRSGMSHAKSGRKTLLPQNEAERQSVTDSLGRLTRFYLKLAEAHLGARRPGGGMFAAFFTTLAVRSLDAMTVCASDDDTPFDASDVVPNPGGGAMKELVAFQAAQSLAPFLVTRLWAAASSDLGALPSIRRIVGVHDGQPAMAAVLEGQLVLGSSHKFEAMLGIRASNVRQPRTVYSF